MPRKAIIVGAGLSGLSCALHLREAGVEACVLEASDGVGGRVRTDVVDGFRLDRGFQVFLDAYPEAGKVLDLAALDLKRFRPGALVFRDGKMRRVMDVFRCPQHLVGSALAPIGTLADRLHVAKLRFQSRRPTAGGDGTTEALLRGFGFSEGMIDGFFRPFYGGIFLERELRTSARMFQFTFDMFARGHATLPSQGMQAIPNQLAARLPADGIRLNTPVRAVEAKAVVLESGERIETDAVIVATDATAADRLLQQPSAEAAAWRGVTGLYFAAPESPLREAIIVLNGGDSGLVNNVCVLSDVAPTYAPNGQSLVSVSVLGTPDAPDLESRVQAELETWFGSQVKRWRHLRTDRISHALPEQPTMPLHDGVLKRGGVFVCGDHCTSASIEGAIVSGKQTAEAFLAHG